MLPEICLTAAAKHPAFSTDRLDDIDKTKHDRNKEQHKNLNNQTGELPTYAQST